MEINKNLKEWYFTEDDGKFILDSPDESSFLYFPIANASGMMSVISPELHGDVKTSQNTFLIEPVSSNDLHNTRSARNFWLYIESKGAWSVSGNSSCQRTNKYSSDKEKVVMEAGFLWHKVSRENKEIGILAEITNFVPAIDNTVELMEVKITNISDEKLEITPTAAIPIYCRSADNVRDHRHVTSLLNRISLVNNGIVVKPTLSFDERGHQKNYVSYAVFGSDENENPPVGFFPVSEDFIGEGGTFDWPEVIIKNQAPLKLSEDLINGYEAIGALRFKKITLNKGESNSFRLVLSINENGDNLKDIEYLKKEKFKQSFDETEMFWNKKLAALKFNLGDKKYNQWMKWVTLQPILRRIYGCSFMPHHDYGRGGRGWRDLWQDCLALLLMEPYDVKNLLLNNFAGVRIDGTNATIIGKNSGEFLADRNNIPRVWMDHGVWPFLATKLYIDQTGDLDFLLEEQSYFKDKHTARCTAYDNKWNPDGGACLKTKNNEIYKGTVLEHILVQHLTSFFHVGDNNNILLEGADWNDGFDMAEKKGESVTFSALYAGNLLSIAELLQGIKKRKNLNEVKIAAEILILLNTLNNSINYNSKEEKRKILDEYYEACKHSVLGEKVKVSIDDMVNDLSIKGNSLSEHIRKNEWISNREGYSWFNGYYDNDGKRVEGDDSGYVRMTLTGQVFPIMSGISTNEQTKEVIKSIDKYLWDPDIGGCRLNTNFNEVLLNIGRCFGFAFGHKENGSVFSHMTVMYANALYTRGFALEGFKVLEKLYTHCIDFKKCRIYPGIPEYINQKGRGMYNYLTGAASWLLLTVLTRVFGVRGIFGDMLIQPMLTKKQFNKDGIAEVQTLFANKIIIIKYNNNSKKEYGDYSIQLVKLNNNEIEYKKYNNNGIIIKRTIIENLKNTGSNIFEIILG